MGRTRAFLPPAVCSRCHERPALGETLFHTGAVWLCAACLTENEPGDDVLTKMARRSIQAEELHAESKRARVAGDIEQAVLLEHEANWHQHAMTALRDNGERQVRDVTVVNGEALPGQSGYLRDTLADPGLVAVESSHTRGRLLHANDVVALGIDVSNSAGAANTHEKLVAHEIALAHKVAMEQANRAQHERDPVIELKRLQISARMMAMAQEGVLTLQKLNDRAACPCGIGWASGGWKYRVSGERLWVAMAVTWPVEIRSNPE
jgi:hypothetical protein